MKTVAIFSEKGGMGKSTLTVMFASWLAYKQGQEVLVMDFDAPGYRISGMRRRDLDAAKKVPRYGAMCSQTPYKIMEVPQKAMESQEKIDNLAQSIRRFTNGPGVALFDFPGQFREGDVAWHCLKAGAIDLLVLLADSDTQSQESALYVNSVVTAPGWKVDGPQPVTLVWNREADSERRHNTDWYGTPENLFRAVGVDVCPIRIKEALIMRRDPPTFGFVRSSLCWPEVNVRSRCPYITDIFTYIKDKLELD